MTDLAQLSRDLDLLREDVDYLVALNESRLMEPEASPVATGPESDGGAAHVWQELDAREAAAAWQVLTEWVDWLVGRYALDDTLPNCWYRHGALIDELDALRAAWRGAYLAPQARLIDPSYWHELLTRTLIRIRDWDRYGCVAGTHADEAPASGCRSVDDARADHLRADVQARADSRTHEPDQRWPGPTDTSLRRRS
jgi:hypothetical protein